jgi:hypothetical protein
MLLMSPPCADDAAGIDLDLLAIRIRDRCREAAVRAYDDAGIQGLCAEGRWEAVLGAIETLELKSLLQDLAGGVRSDPASRLVPLATSS